MTYDLDLVLICEHEQVPLRAAGTQIALLRQ